VPDGPIPGLPDPDGTAGAVRDQLAGNLGLQVSIDVMPLDAFRAHVADGTLTGLYLDGIAASVADPSAFLEPLFTAQPASLAARRAVGVTKALATAASTADPAARDAAFAAAATSLRTTVPLAPLVHPGTATAYRSDVKGAVASPLGTDPLGAMTAGDRGQVVFMAASAPVGGWCGSQPSMDAYRLCGLVTDGLYGTAPASLDPAPRLAASCAPGADTTTWTCRLQTARTSGGLALDAADVVATFRAMGDPSDPVHKAAGDAAFSAWTAVFGAFLPGATP
jgi:ABC-type transport system substrate-binding protein